MESPSEPLCKILARNLRIEKCKLRHGGLKMNKIVLASHGDLAQGMRQTAEMIIGTSENIYALSAFRDEDEAIGVQMERLLEKIGYKDVYLLTDIFGGSVNNDLLTIQQAHPEVTLIAGMNLPLVISVATQFQQIDEDMLGHLIEESQQGMINCKQLLKQQIQIGGDDL